MINKAISLSHRDWAIQTADAWNAVGVCDHCVYVPGDVNNNGVASGMDIVYLSSYLKGNLPILNPCDLDYQPTIIDFFAAADYNGDCAVNGMDVSYGVNYFKGFEPDIKWCPHFTPGTE